MGDEYNFDENEACENFGDGQDIAQDAERTDFKNEGSVNESSREERGGRGGGGDSKPPRESETNPQRVFIKNLSFDTNMKQLKEFIADKCGSCFVDVHKKPTSGKSAGSATVCFDDESSYQFCIGLSGTEFMNREIEVVPDHENNEFKSFAEAKGYGVFVDRKGRPHLNEKEGYQKRDFKNDRGGGGRFESRGRDFNGRDGGGGNDRYNRNDRGRSERRPPNNFGIHGKPLINEIHDLTDSVLFFSGFRSQASEEEIAKFFEEVGPVQKIDLRTHDNKSGSDSRGIGTVQFSRCRDAKRAVIMLDNKEYAGKRISLRNARERRHFPNGLANLGRPLPEPQVADQCRQQGIDPFQSADLFIGKLNSYDSSEDGLREIFNFIGDCYRVNVLRFRDNDKKVSGAMARFSSALDAQQVINVLDNSVYLGKPFGCRFDRLITGGFKPQNDGDKKESPMMGKFQQENGVLPSEGNPEYKSNYIQATQMKQPGPFRNQEDVQFAPGQYQQAMQQPMQQVMGHSMQQQPMQQPPMQSQPNFGQFGQASNENRFQTNSSMNDYGFPTPNLGRPPPSAIYGSANTPVKRPNPYSSQIRDDTRSRSPLRKQQTGDDDDVQKLASRLGISKKMLNAIRVLANDDDDATDQSKPETSTPTDNKNVNFSQANPTQLAAQGTNSHGTNSPKPSASNYGHEATTMDTIYVRNIPGHFSELRLRSFMKECGEVTFMDFPLKSDGTPVGYAYVRFGGQECKESARKAISDFDKMVLDNFKLEVGMY